MAPLGVEHVGAALRSAGDHGVGLIVMEHRACGRGPQVVQGLVDGPPRLAALLDVVRAAAGLPVSAVQPLAQTAQRKRNGREYPPRLIRPAGFARGDRAALDVLDPPLHHAPGPED